MRPLKGNYETLRGELRDLWREWGKYMQGNYEPHDRIGFDHEWMRNEVLEKMPIVGTFCCDDLWYNLRHEIL